MPNSLWDMFQPQDAAGQPASLGDAFTSRSNSLIGLGLGLLAPSNPLRGQSSWGQALEGFQGGAQIDARTAAAAAQLKQHRADQARAQANADRAFARSGETDFQKIQADIQKYGEPARQFYANKAGDTSSIVKITNPNTGEDESVLYNPRAPAGQQFRPVPTDIFNPRAADVALGEVRDQPLKYPVVTDAETEVADAGRGVTGQLERVAFVVTPGAQVD